MTEHEKYVEVLEQRLKVYKRLGLPKLFQEALTYAIQSLKQPKLEELDEEKVDWLIGLHLADPDQPDKYEKEFKELAHDICQKFGKQPKEKK